ncbi:MAG TPA: S8 family peptidase [Chloroflexota bacterium]|nr:S8 family peptidase [Chloroflexota bacterium]
MGRGVLVAVVALVLAFGPHGPGRLSAPGVAAAQDAASKIAPALQQRMLATPSKMLPVIVEMEHPPLPFVGHPNVQRAQEALELLRLYGQPVGALPLLDGAAGFADAAAVTALALAPGVAFVHEDATVGPRRPAPAAWPPGALAAAYPRAVGADRAWRGGWTGKGVTVAVLDSGVEPDADLTQPTNRLLAAANFAGSRGPQADPGGHGTHVAGIVAGNGARSGGQYVGIAPEANVVDVRVLDGTGHGRVSSVVRGITWVLAHRARYNIRVLNLSFGAPSRGSYRADPLAAAVEVAWRRGLVVVAAAGNGGPSGGTVETPGIDPYVLTVGATDDRGSVPTADDRLAWFSAWGTPPGASPKPDLVAPGRRLVSLRVPGSTLDRLYPDRVVAAAGGATYFRLTGTSMAAPVAAGAAALVLQRQPGLSPDQVKALLTGTSGPYGPDGGAGAADGSGLLAVDAALQGAPPGAANRGLRPADGLARVLYPALYGQPLAWRDPLYLGTDWLGLTWATLAWDDGAWDNLDWDAFRWDDAAWDDAAWDDAAWDDAAWDDAAWDDAAWDGLAVD